ncbi:hypothetical protein [Luteimonas fraxinea]|uniref:Uncharacterized protein n=1 Tax=Luteimonas fraxinea TaxID=2901869 RepID=A0ABS8UBV3_9GAMM|nr:hypothetical protein [Luteimonas fraxinea]MCD9096211.1 hypothetical protein [Luteimonas fraxinea]
MPNPLFRMISEELGIFDKLYAPRMEVHFDPNPDGSTSTRGRVVFWTQWWHFRDGVVHSKSDGPRIERDFDTLQSRQWGSVTSEDGTMDTGDLISGITQAFVEIATEALTPMTEIPDTQPS